MPTSIYITAVLLSDYLGKLIREDNTKNNETYVYTYDNAGNITSKKTYALTAANSTPSSLKSTYNYGYSSSDWGDPLTSYRGVGITYDGIGNPLSYYNGTSYSFSWTGRELSSAIVGGKSMSFSYNSEGIRTTKTVSGVTTTYYLSGSKIIAEANPSYTVIYLYEADGSPYGFQYISSTSSSATAWESYVFEKNLQGDIVAVYDPWGAKYISYSYDAWGNATVTYHNGGESTKAAKNPFRYRGYYYDSDLGLYYLNARYYDSKLGRFISPDSEAVITATPTGLTDKNLYAYCDNNPVIRTDRGGEFWNYVIGGLAGAIVGATVAAVNGEDIAGIAIGALSGAASGVVAASGLGFVAQAGISAGISAAADFANQSIDIVSTNGNIEDYNLMQTGVEAIIGFGTSIAGSVLGKCLDLSVAKNSAKSKMLYDNYLNKTFTAVLRQEVGRSSSALLRQANKFLTQSNLYLNIERGLSSVIGSGISLWNLAR